MTDQNSKQTSEGIFVLSHKGLLQVVQKNKIEIDVRQFPGGGVGIWISKNGKSKVFIYSEGAICESLGKVRRSPIPEANKLGIYKVHALKMATKDLQREDELKGAFWFDVHVDLMDCDKYFIPFKKAK